MRNAPCKVSDIFSYDIGFCLNTSLPFLSSTRHPLFSLSASDSSSLHVEQAGGDTATYNSLCDTGFESSMEATEPQP